MCTSAFANEGAVRSFFEELQRALPDPRMPRGMRHDLSFTTLSIVLAMLNLNQTVSSMHRFIIDRLPWLRKLTGMRNAQAVSRAHLPRLLDLISWDVLSELIFRRFGVELDLDAWLAIDGKALRGSAHGGDRLAIVTVVSHATGEEHCCLPQAGVKTSEISVVREVLAKHGLDKGHVTLDALHCNPDTLCQISAAFGTYLTQVKQNQPELLHHCVSRGLLEPPLARLSTVGKGHGRVTTRDSQLHVLRRSNLDLRWYATGLRYLIVTTRTTYNVKKQTTSVETSYYITNASSAKAPRALLAELAKAIRGHWRVESNNWARDVTLGEDRVIVCARNQALVMALLRSLVLAILHRMPGGNRRAKLECLCRRPRVLTALLRRIHLL